MLDRSNFPAAEGSRSCRRGRTRLWQMAVPWLILSANSMAEPPTADQRAFFEKRIRPVLVEKCYGCHSGKAKSVKGGLRLDFRDSTRRGGENGPAVVPGKPEKSLLIAALRYQSLEMPPDGKLPDQVVQDFVRWIKMGAPDPRDNGSQPTKARDPKEGRDHWAFQPVKPPQRPKVRNADWPLKELDHFLLAALEAKTLQPAPDADRNTWLRRVTLDLSGLPPDVDHLRSFVQDRSPLAHAKVVDRLLASPAFGERWARHWLDLVGYADQIGTSNSVFAQHAWRYRDYVIQAFNSDKPFDQFVREQIAGDLMQAGSARERAGQLTATGFLVLGDLEIVEADKAKLNVDIIDQQVDKTGRAFLAMTVGCARCHDHKFDPIPQRDYYALAGYFHNTDSIFKTKRGVWSDVLTSALPETEEQRANRRRLTGMHTRRIDDLKRQHQVLGKSKAKVESQLAEAKQKKSSDQIKTLTKQRDQIRSRLGQLKRELEHAEYFAPGVARVYSVRDRDEISEMRITIRGNPRALGQSVPRGYLQVISRPPQKTPTARSGRLQLANWIADPSNPLTARVAVNRIWQKLFGEGIVRSVDYFGLRGETPSHPQLLDYLASRFVRDGWSQKQLIRRLVLSRAYRMSSAHNDKADAADPDNRLLWRMNRRRLGAEAIRDSFLFVSGRLDTTAGGSALPLEFLENVANIDPKSVNPASFSLRRWRPHQAYQRTIYLPVIRSGAQPRPAELRNIFDFTQPAGFRGRRSVTAVPTQALFLMNSPVVKGHARDLAARLLRSEPDSERRLDLLWKTTFSRPIKPIERKAARRFLSESADSRQAWAELCHAILASNEFLMRL